jgi:hypothetical protein
MRARQHRKTLREHLFPDRAKKHFTLRIFCIYLKTNNKNCQKQSVCGQRKTRLEIFQVRFKTYVGNYQALMARIRLVRRETLRDAVFLWSTPFWAPRISCGSADFMASKAASLLPALMASSTLRNELRTMLVRFLLIEARRAETRVAFLADDVLAISLS